MTKREAISRMKGGGKPYLPLPPTVTDATSFRANFDLLSITAHGSQDGYSFLVPENVFICFRGPSGATIERRRHQDAVLNQFRYKNPGETDQQYTERLYTAIRDKRLFREFLAPENDPFAPGSMSIYEPGDVIQNIGLQMHNLAYPYGLIGVWQVPLPHEYLEELNTLNQSYDDAFATSLPSDSQLTAILQAEGTPAKDIPIAIDLLKKDEKKKLNEVFKDGELAFSQKPQNAQHWLGLPDEHPSLYDVLQTMRRSVLGHAPAVTKPFVFIVIEACREAFELQQMNLLSGAEHVTALEHRGIEAERMAALEAATAKFYRAKANVIATMAKKIGNVLKPVRRRSLNVRNFPGVCTRSLFLLSKDYITRLQPTTPQLQTVKARLLAGEKVPSQLVDELTQEARAVNTSVSNLPFGERFYPGEIVKVRGTGQPGIVKGVMVAPGLGAAGGSGPSSGVRYQITALNSDTLSVANSQVAPTNLEKATSDEKEEFEGMRLSLNNAGMQKALTYERPAVSVASIFAQPSQIPIGAAYGKGFYIPASLAPYQSNIESQLGKVEMKMGASLKARNRLEFTAGTKAGQKVELLPELGYPLEESAKGYKQLRFKVLENDGTTSLINPAVFKKVGGGRKTRRGQSTKFLRGKFCRCIKKVSKTVKAKRSQKEKAAIGICVKSVLGTRKRTLYKFSCKKGKLQTQDPFRRR